MINIKIINEILCILFFHAKLPILVCVFHFEIQCVRDITPPFLTSHISSSQQPPVASGCPLRDHPLPNTEQPSCSPSTTFYYPLPCSPYQASHIIPSVCVRFVPQGKASL